MGDLKELDTPCGVEMVVSNIDPGSMGVKAADGRKGSSRKHTITGFSVRSWPRFLDYVLRIRLPLNEISRSSQSRLGCNNGVRAFR